MPCSVYGVWAASGEIDIMEARGNPRLNDTVEGTLHCELCTLHCGLQWQCYVVGAAGPQLQWCVAARLWGSMRSRRRLGAS